MKVKNGQVFVMSYEVWNPQKWFAALSCLTGVTGVNHPVQRRYQSFFNSCCHLFMQLISVPLVVSMVSHYKDADS